MTQEAWRACLQRFEREGNPNERMMAWLLVEISLIRDERIEQIFDGYASKILEAAP